MGSLFFPRLPDTNNTISSMRIIPNTTKIREYIISFNLRTTILVFALIFFIRPFSHKLLGVLLYIIAKAIGIFQLLQQG